MFPTPRARSRGISIIEIMLVLGVVGVILSFASASISSAAAKAELRAAVENMELSVRMARNTARQLESDVIMHLNAGPGEERNSVTFTFPKSTSNQGAKSLLQDFQFPENIKLVSEQRTVHFDNRGIVEVSTPVLLVSVEDDDINQGLVIE